METLKNTTYNLSEETRLEDILIWGDVYAVHRTAGREIIITAHGDYSKIYMITSLQFYNLLIDGPKHGI